LRRREKKKRFNEEKFMRFKAQAMEELKAAIEKKAQQHGFAVLSSPATPGREAMAHTVGLWASCGHPDLAIFGAPPEQAERWLSDLGQKAMASEGRPLPKTAPCLGAWLEIAPMDADRAELPRAMSQWSLGETSPNAQWMEARAMGPEAAEAARAEWESRESWSSKAIDWMARQAPAETARAMRAKKTFWGALGALGERLLSGAAAETPEAGDPSAKTEAGGHWAWRPEEAGSAASWRIRPALPEKPEELMWTLGNGREWRDPRALGERERAWRELTGAGSAEQPRALKATRKWEGARAPNLRKATPRRDFTRRAGPRRRGSL
jgi:hypothetical protein